MTPFHAEWFTVCHIDLDPMAMTGQSDSQNRKMDSPLLHHVTLFVHCVLTVSFAIAATDWVPQSEADIWALLSFTEFQVRE